MPSSTVGAVGCLLIAAETILRTTNSVFQRDFVIVAPHAASRELALARQSANFEGHGACASDHADPETPTGDGDRPTVAGNNAIDYGQTHASSLAHSLGCEKWLKNTLHDLRCHTVSGITDQNAGMWSRRERRMRGSKICSDLNGIKMYRQHTARFTHGMLGIGAQVHEHLLELGWIRQDRAGCGRQTGVDGNRGRQ